MISSPPKTIPVFPLPGVLLLPRARLPLNIFEKRYLTMIDDALKTDHRLIGMVQPRETPKGKNEPCLQQIGCAGRITSFSETEDGRYMITLSGFSRFRVRDANEGFTPYVKAGVDWSSFHADRTESEIDARFDRPKFFKTLSKFFKATQLSTDWDSLKEADEELLVNSLSMLCHLNQQRNRHCSKHPTLQIAAKRL